MQNLKNIFVSLFFIISFSLTNAQLSVNLSDTLNKVFESSFNSQNVKSAGAAVYFPDGSIWTAAQGNLGGNTPLTTDHLMEMGSNTKVFTAAAILKLQEQGLLSIDDTIYQYLQKKNNVPSGITIKQLLNHTSGIYSYTNSANFGNFVNNDPFTKLTPDSILSFVEAPLFAAGTDWDYSNTNYVLLGLIIEEVAGKPYHEVLKTMFFDPLNLENIYLETYENYNAPKAGSWLSGGTYLGIDFVSFLSSAWAAGGIVSTTADLAQWAHMLFSGKVLEPNSLDLMKTTAVVNLQQTNYGLGYIRSTYKGFVYSGHGGATLQHSTMNFSETSKFAVVCNVNDQGKANQVINIERALLNVLENQLPLFPYEPLNIAETEISSIELFPNPAQDFISISTESKLNVEIFNINGQPVKMINSAQNIIDISELPKGVYFVKIWDNNNKFLECQKLVKQ